ncbi:DUF3472 domain-containing protein [Pedobacter sp. MW01-1-1]|uniref:DUF3472 domain-containing protein n=1 Tax=Pedobacter sp. MW01-1-1 TaxID=3383027 RepID=UPI003FF12125
MNLLKRSFLLIVGTLYFGITTNAQNTISLPVGGNFYSSKSILENAPRIITNNGIRNWTDASESISAYFRIAKPGTINIAFDDKPIVEGESTISFSILQKGTKITLTETKEYNQAIGEWNIKDTGYVCLTIKGIKKSSNYFPSFKSLKISGTAIDSKTAFVPNNEGNFFHWGRRGPSVHLNYLQPNTVNAEWFYTEITVPTNEDKIGSYFMACGFGEGYFGMQVNSPTERRVLFSVWSPFTTNDPKSIPDSHKIKLLKKGENVNAKDFGGEGSGGQSFLKYTWKAGNTYKFLLHGKPDTDSTTTYTAYFFSPENKSWQLIASFKRPLTKTYLKRFHSFLENFSPEQGDKSRKGLYNNQWICDDKGNWMELTRARFTTDETGAKGYRMDYAGGVDNGSFFMKDGGFFNTFTKPGTIFYRPASGKQPVIDFTKLP